MKKKINWERIKNQRMSSNNDYLSAVKKILTESCSHSIFKWENNKKKEWMKKIN